MITLIFLVSLVIILLIGFNRKSFEKDMKEMDKYTDENGNNLFD